MKRLGPSLALILIGTALLLSGANNGHASNQKRNNNKHREHTTAQNAHTQEVQAISPAFYAAILGELRTLVNQEVVKREQEHIDNKDWNTPMFWITVGLVGVGGGYIVVGLCQLAAIKKQADIAERSLRIAQRAVIGIKGIHFELAKRPITRIFFENYGRTGATNIRTQIKGYVDTDPPNKTDYVGQELPQIVKEVVAELMPNIVAVQPLDTDLTELSDEFIAAIREGRMYAYVVGRIFYHDGFEDRETPLFCYWLDVLHGEMRPAWRDR